MPVNAIWLKLVAQLRAFEPIFLVRIYLVMFAGLALLFGTLPFSPHGGVEHLALIVGIMIHFPMVREGPHLTKVLYGGLMMAIVFILSLAKATTGINSIDLIWLMIMGLPVLFLLGIRTGLIWWLIVESVLAVLYGLSRWGFMGHQVVPTAPLASYVLVSYLMALLSIMLMLSLYDLQQRSRINALDEGNRFLEENYKSLFKSQRHKEEFVAAIGHELRTPMSAILGLNPLLREAVGNQSEWQAAVDHIRRSTQQLLGVVNNVLDHSQLQANRLFLMPSSVNVRDLIEEIRDEISDRIESNAMRLDCRIAEDVPEFVWMDRARFRQILSNLLDNAIKHAPNGSVVTLKVTVHQSRLNVEVDDQGPGLPSEILVRMSQGLPLHPRIGEGHLTGAGLGLSICQALVSLHQGRMWAETMPSPGGTRMHFDWPLANEPQVKALRAQSDWGELKQKPLQFLVVDDEPVNLVVVSSQIRKHMPHSSVQTVNQINEALDNLSQTRFDVLILDMFMPDMGGQELTKRVRESGNLNEGTLILALTASSNPDDWRACLQAGMNGVLVKPFDINELLNAIHHHSRIRSGEQS